MRPRRREGVQGGEIGRTSSVFQAQIAANTPYKLRRTALERERAAQKEQVARLHRLDVGAKGRRWLRQVDAKVSEPFFSSSARCVRGHVSSAERGYHRPRCIP